MLFRRFRLAVLSLTSASFISAAFIASQQVFPPLVQAQTSSSSATKPTWQLTPDKMFVGTWISETYECPIGGTRYTERISITLIDNFLEATKLTDNPCLPKDQQTFAGYPCLNISAGSSFPVTYITGTPKTPASGSQQFLLTVVDANTFTIGSQKFVRESAYKGKPLVSPPPQAATQTGVGAAVGAATGLLGLYQALDTETVEFIGFEEDTPPKKCLPCTPVPAGGFAYEYHSVALGNKPHDGMNEHTHHFKMNQSPVSKGCICGWNRRFKKPTPRFSPLPNAVPVEAAGGGGIAP